LPLLRPRSPATRLPRVRPSTSGLRSAERCVPRGRWLAFPSVAPLLGFLLLRALASPPSTRFPGPSAPDVVAAVFFAPPFERAGLAALPRLQRLVSGLAGVLRLRDADPFEVSSLPLAAPCGATSARLLGEGRFHPASWFPLQGEKRFHVPD
jgi:hypothetical protein